MEPKLNFFRVQIRGQKCDEKKCEPVPRQFYSSLQNLTLRTVVLSRHYIADFPLLNSYPAAILIVIALTVCHVFHVHHCKLNVMTGVVRI